MYNHRRMSPFAVLAALLLVVLSGCTGGAEPAGPGQSLPPTPLQQPTATVPAASTPAPAATETAAEVGETAVLPAMQTVEPTATYLPLIANAAVLPPTGSVRWVEVTGGFDSPVGFVDPADGSGRFFVLEQAGVIRTVQDGVLLDEPFLDLRDRVGSAGSEQGLLGMDVEPGFGESGRFYLNYTDLNGDTVIARYHVRGDNPMLGDPGSETVLLHQPQPYANHNGGGVEFGPDGYLYLSLGDGGSGGDPEGNAQNTQVLLGKILRIDVSGEGAYTIPPDNPFAGGGNGRPEIWAWGLRNPWRFSFDQATGDLYIADVGQNSWEEVNFVPAGSPGGENYGWDYYEGTAPYEGTPPEGLALVFPVDTYGRDRGCSVTGGYVYRGQRIPALNGVYLYSDYCLGQTWGLLRNGSGEWESQLLVELDARVSAFGQDAAGEIYVLDHGRGVLYRLESQ